MSATKLCRFWQLLQCYDADDSIGGGEFSPSEELEQARQDQLSQTPRCGTCSACVEEQEDQENLLEDPDLLNKCDACPSMTTNPTDEHGRVLCSPCQAKGV